jgi:DNA-binding NarL/FixJ family response regulator
MTSVDGNRLGLVAIEADATGLPWLPLETSVKMALAVTDHQWVIEHASSDTEALLGLGPEAYEGSSLLALLQPADVQGFMGAVGRVAAGGGAATLRLHFRTETGRWQDVYCVVVAMCRHSPPRLGLALALISEPGGETACRQIAARGVDALNCMEQFQSRLPQGNLSMRQWEILTRLVRGQRVQEIADALYLSPSTVRNHLTAIYRKFGVHSQAELLAALLNVPD